VIRIAIDCKHSQKRQSKGQGSGSSHVSPTSCTVHHVIVVNQTCVLSPT
jgi:hypothetical protein